MINVWLVEDNGTYRRNLARATRRDESLRCGREFDSVEDALGALETEPPPDVILLDVALPGMDGIAGIPHLLQHAQGASIVILTAFDDPDKIYRAICAGASGYLLKTATIEEVARAVRQAAEGGAPMTPSVAHRVLERFSEISPQPPKEGTYSLTSRELDTLRLMADGFAKKEIATKLGISSHTVNTHIRNIYGKLHVNTNTGAVAKAVRERLV